MFRKNSSTGKLIATETKRERAVIFPVLFLGPVGFVSIAGGTFMGILFGITAWLYMYFLVVMSVNTFFIHITDTEIVVSHKPLPFIGLNRRIPLIQVISIRAAKEEGTRFKSTYWVEVELSNGKTKILLLTKTFRRAQEITQDLKSAVAFSPGDEPHFLWASRP